MAPQLEAASIDDALLKTIYDQDQALHPAALSFSRLQSWHDACPNLSIVCKLNGNAVGAIIAMPLQKQSWEDLLSGRLKEHHVETSMFVAEGAEGKDVGLHVFHVERFEGHEAVRGIGKLATKLLQDVANKKSWNIVGYSALTASDGGRAVFSRLGFEPTGYQEVFLKTSDEQLPVVPIGPHEEVTDISKVDGDIVSRSVMVVRHGNDTFQ